MLPEVGTRHADEVVDRAGTEPQAALGDLALDPRSQIATLDRGVEDDRPAAGLDRSEHSVAIRAPWRARPSRGRWSARARRGSPRAAPEDRYRPASRTRRAGADRGAAALARDRRAASRRPRGGTRRAARGRRTPRCRAAAGGARSRHACTDRSTRNRSSPWISVSWFRGRRAPWTQYRKRSSRALLEAVRVRPSSSRSPSVLVRSTGYPCGRRNRRDTLGDRHRELQRTRGREQHRRDRAARRGDDEVGGECAAVDRAEVLLVGRPGVPEDEEPPSRIVDGQRAHLAAGCQGDEAETSPRRPAE